jgi:hypothetical protein
MCGFPYHVLEKYSEKLRKKHDVVLVDVDAKGEVKVYPMVSVKETVSKKESVTEHRTQETAKETAPEGVGEWSDVYERLRTPLSNLPRFQTGDFLFRVYKNGDTYQGYVDKVNQSEGGYPVSDARGLHYKSIVYNNRADAVEDIISVARNNKLLEESTTNNTDGGITNGTEQSEQKANADQRRTETTSDRGNEGTQTQNADGREISEGNGEVQRESDRFRSGRRELNQTEKRFPDDAYIVPKKGTVEAEEYAKLLNSRKSDKLKCLSLFLYTKTCS